MAEFSLIKWLEDLINPLAARISRDMAAMRNELAPWKEKLVPIMPGEWDLLSSQYVPQDGRRRKGAPLKGLFSTIYQESVIAWSYREYQDQNHTALLVARTCKQEYLFKRVGREVEVVIGPYRVGALSADGRLISSRKKELLAQLGKPNGTYIPVLVYGHEVGAIALPSDTPVPMPRAFSFVQDMAENEMELFLALAIYELVRQKINK
ncbi:MAG: hypothetical protein IPH04_15095 [Saprospirales bacterium]|jgi:hypothetical protein|nr:hypothetical protein [Saprospirales bacterium]MBK6904079.1 hypothetical protein [Saprospirales bacterium]MBK7335869.1 hypothetical protein [Saprospirales bacterium]